MSLEISVLDDVAEAIDDLGDGCWEPGIAVHLPVPDDLDLVPDVVKLNGPLGLDGDRGPRGDPVAVDVVAAGADVAGILEGDDLAGDGEGGG